MMKYINNLTISEKHRLIIVTVIFCIGLLSASVWKVMDSFNDQSAKTEATAELEVRLLRIKNNVLRGELLQMFVADRKSQRAIIDDSNELLNDRIEALNLERGQVNTEGLPLDIVQAYKAFNISLDAYLDFIDKNLHDIQTVMPEDSLRYVKVRDALLIDLNKQFTPLRENAANVVAKTQAYRKEIITEYSHKRNIAVWILATIAIAMILVISIFIRAVSRSLVVQIYQAKDVLEKMSQGELPVVDEARGKNELSAMLNTLRLFAKQMHHLKEFAGNVASNNFEISAKMFDGKGSIAHALENMRDNLKKSFVEEAERKWTAQGMIDFGNITRYQDNVNTLYDHALGYIIKYLSANQGTLFAIDDHDTNHHTLKRVSVYAYERKKYINGSIRIGEGLAGQAFLERELILLKEVPDNYLKITSGLGESLPGFIIVSPLILNGEPYGVLEIALLSEPAAYKIEFVKRVSEELASLIKAAGVNTHTHKLLKETQHKEEKLRLNEEAMRQTIEELHATQEAEARRSQELQRSYSELELSKQRMEQASSLAKTKEEELLEKDKSLFNTRMANLRANAAQLSGQIKACIDTALNASRTCAQMFAVFAEDPELFPDAREQANRMLQSILKNNATFLATYTLWEADQLDYSDQDYICKPGHDDTGRFIPYWTMQGNEFHLEPLVNYTREGDGDYFMIPQKTNREAVIDPYLYPVQGKDVWIISAVAPVTIADKFRAICGVDFAIDQVMEMIDNVNWREDSITIALIANNKQIVKISGDNTFTGKPSSCFIPDAIMPEDLNESAEVIWEGNTYLFEPVMFGETNRPWTVCIKTST
jgi:hypothetical protein